MLSLLMVNGWLLTRSWRRDLHEHLQSWSEDEDGAQYGDRQENPQEDPV